MNGEQEIRRLLASSDVAEIEEGLRLLPELPALQFIPGMYGSIWKMTYACAQDPEFTALSAGPLSGRMALMNAQEDLVPLPHVPVEEIASLDLGGFPEAVFFPELLRYKKLKRLSLWENSLKTLPADLFRLDTLEYLYICDELEELPPRIGELKNLKQLLLSGNRLRSVPPEIARLQQLEELDLSSNRLRHFNLDIGRMPALKQIDLGGNDPQLQLSSETAAYLEKQAEHNDGLYRLQPRRDSGYTNNAYS